MVTRTRLGVTYIACLAYKSCNVYLPLLLYRLFYFCIVWLSHCFVYQFFFNSDSSTLGFLLGLATLSFCSMCCIVFVSLCVVYFFECRVLFFVMYVILCYVSL